MHADRPIRLFVAVYPGLERAHEMLRVLDGRPLGPLRLTPPEQIHITVHFIGDTRRADLDEVAESVSRSVAGLPTFELRPIRLRSLPERGSPRLIALETGVSATLLEVHRRLVTRLARSPRHADRFLPHFTLARHPPDSRPLRVDQPVDMEPLTIGAVRLMSSVLRAAGASHAPVGSWPLGG